MRPERPANAKNMNSLQQAGLAAAIYAGKYIEARRKKNIDRFEIAKTVDHQPLNNSHVFLRADS
jgi:ABC-type phosphate/phosphonate transport system substrate-binding protein